MKPSLLADPPIKNFWAASRLIAQSVVSGPWFLCSAALTFILGLIASLADGVSVGLVILFFYMATGHGSDVSAGTGLAAQFFEVMQQLTGGNLGILVGIMAVLVLLKATITVIYGKMTASSRHHINEVLRNALSRQLLRTSFHYINRYEHGDFLETIIGQSWCVAECYAAALRVIISLAALLIFGVFLLATSIEITLIAGFGFILLFLIVNFFCRRARILGEKVAEAQQSFSEKIMMVLSGMRPLRLFAQEDRIETKLILSSATIREHFQKLDKIQASIGPISEAGFFIILLVIIAVVHTQALPFASSLAAVALLYRLQPYLRDLEQNRLRISEYGFSLSVVASLLNPSDKSYPPQGNIPFHELKSDIIFENVSLRYDNAGTDALSNASFTIPHGKVTLLQGPSGSGKTSIINLLARLYEPSQGQINANGQNINDLRRADWLSHIAFAGQDVGLFEGTIAENIIFGFEGATQQMLEQAAKLAGFAETVEALPKKYETHIGEQGGRLSHGQRQRLGLARALLRNPQILILDEATSGIENALETSILSNILEAMKGRTIVLVSHQLGMEKLADTLLYIENGHVKK